MVLYLAVLWETSSSWPLDTSGRATVLFKTDGAKACAGDLLPIHNIVIYTNQLSCIYIYAHLKYNIQAHIVSCCMFTTTPGERPIYTHTCTYIYVYVEYTLLLCIFVSYIYIYYDMYILHILRIYSNTQTPQQCREPANTLLRTYPAMFSRKIVQLVEPARSLPKKLPMEAFRLKWQPSYKQIYSIYGYIGCFRDPVYT